MFLIPVVIAAAAIASFLYYYYSRAFKYWQNKNVIGPKPVLFFGNLKESALRRKHVGVIYKEIYDMYPKERFIGFYRMANASLIIRDLELVKRILIKDFDSFSERGIEFSKEGLGDNLFHCDTKTWHALRSRLTPLFTLKKLKNTFHLIDEDADKLVNYLQAVTFGAPEKEMHHIFKKYTMASIMSTAFGINVNMLNDNYESIEKVGHYIFRSTYRAEMDMLFPGYLLKTKRSLYPALVNDFSYEVVRSINKQRNRVSTIRNDNMGALLALRNESDIEEIKRCKDDKEVRFQITDHVMAGQVFIFFAAGFGNNALSLSYTLFELAKHKDAQDKLIQEVDDVLAKYDGKLSYDAVKEMPYLDNVYSEILRMYTLTNSIQRVATKSYKIPESDVVIEKNTSVFISPYAIHHDADYYHDPDTFIPERFSPENSANRHPFAFLPFGAGPRSCLGRQLAKLQYFVAITKIFSKFRVEPSERTKKTEDYEPMSTLLATKGGIYVNVIPRRLKH